MASSTKVLSDLLGMSVVMMSPECVCVGGSGGGKGGRLFLGGREEESPCGEMRDIFLKIRGVLENTILSSDFCYCLVR